MRLTTIVFTTGRTHVDRHVAMSPLGRYQSIHHLSSFQVSGQ